MIDYFETGRKTIRFAEFTPNEEITVDSNSLNTHIKGYAEHQEQKRERREKMLARRNEENKSEKIDPFGVATQFVTMLYTDKRDLLETYFSCCMRNGRQKISFLLGDNKKMKEEKAKKLRETCKDQKEFWAYVTTCKNDNKALSINTVSSMLAPKIAEFSKSVLKELRTTESQNMFQSKKMNNLKLVYTEKVVLQADIYAHVKLSKDKRVVVKTVRNMRPYVNLSEKKIFNAILRSKLIHEGSECLIEDCSIVPDFMNALMEASPYDYKMSFLQTVKDGTVEMNVNNTEAIKIVYPKTGKSHYKEWKECVFKEDNVSKQKINLLLNEVCSSTDIMHCLIQMCGNYEHSFQFSQEGEMKTVYCLCYTMWLDIEKKGNKCEVWFRFPNLFLEVDNKLVINENMKMGKEKVEFVGDMVLFSMFMEFMYDEFEGKMYKVMEGMGDENTFIKLSERFADTKLYEQVCFARNSSEYITTISQEFEAHNYKEHANEELAQRKKDGTDKPTDEVKEARKERYLHNKATINSLFSSEGNFSF